MFVLLCVHAGMLGWIAFRYSPTIDEPAHLVAGISHWKFGRFDMYRVNPPLVRLLAGAPLLPITSVQTDWTPFRDEPYVRTEFAVGRAFTWANGPDTFLYFTLARWVCIPFSVAGGLTCYCWARALYGTPSGFTALALWCFCPNILGNGALITPDVGAAALGVAAGYFFWRWLWSLPLPFPGIAPAGQASEATGNAVCGTGKWMSALVAGLMLGLAELTKSTWIILFALWPAFWLLTLVHKVTRIPSSPGSSDFASRQECPQSVMATGGGGFRGCCIDLVQFASIILTAIYVLNLGYGFEDSFQRLDKFQFISHTFGGPEAHSTPGNRFTGTWLGSLPVPLPANYLSGIDVQRYDFENKKWSFLRGERKVGGWWYYYLYGVLVKTPVGTLLLFGISVALAACRFCWRDRSRWVAEMLILAPGITVLVLVSSQTGFNRYFRYVLPGHPFFFIWISQVANYANWFAATADWRQNSLSVPPGEAPLTNLSKRTDPFAGPVGLRHLPICWLAASSGVLLLVGFSIVSSLAVFPHSLSYFNELVGGPRNGHAHLLDGNIDWGQDLLELRNWYNAHPDARPLHVACFGYIAPETAGINYKRIPGVGGKRLENANEILRRGPVPGWYAISIHELFGYKYLEEQPYLWLAGLHPVTTAGYSIQIYHVSRDDVDRLRRELGLPVFVERALGAIPDELIEPHQ